MNILAFYRVGPPTIEPVWGQQKSSYNHNSTWYASSGFRLIIKIETEYRVQISDNRKSHNMAQLWRWSCLGGYRSFPFVFCRKPSSMSRYQRSHSPPPRTSWVCDRALFYVLVVVISSKGTEKYSTVPDTEEMSPVSLNTEHRTYIYIPPRHLRTKIILLSPLLFENSLRDIYSPIITVGRRHHNCRLQTSYILLTIVHVYVYTVYSVYYYYTSSVLLNPTEYSLRVFTSSASGDFAFSRRSATILLDLLRTTITIRVSHMGPT